MAAWRFLLSCLAVLAATGAAPAPSHIPSTVEISGSVVEVERAFQNGLRSVTRTVHALLSDEETAASPDTLKDDISTLRDGVVGGISKLNQSICRVDPPAAPNALRASLKKLEESFNDGVESLNFGAEILASLKADKDNDKGEQSSSGGSEGTSASGSGSVSGDNGPFGVFQQFINNFQLAFQNNMQNFNDTFQNYISQLSGQGNNSSNSQSSGDSNQNPFIQQIQQIGQNFQNAFGGGQGQQQQQQQSDEQTTQPPFWQSISQGFQNSIQNIFRPGASAQAPATSVVTTPATDSTSTTAPATAAQQAAEQVASSAPPAGSERHQGGWGGSNNNAAIGDNIGSSSSGLAEENRLQPTEEPSEKPAVGSEPQSIPELPSKATSEPESQSAPELPLEIAPEVESPSALQSESKPISQPNIEEEDRLLLTAVA